MFSDVSVSDTADLVYNANVTTGTERTQLSKILICVLTFVESTAPSTSRSEPVVTERDAPDSITNPHSVRYVCNSLTFAEFCLLYRKHPLERNKACNVKSALKFLFGKCTILRDVI